MSSLPPSLARDTVSGFLQVSSRPFFWEARLHKGFFSSPSAIFSPYFAGDIFSAKQIFLGGRQIFLQRKFYFGGEKYFWVTKVILQEKCTFRESNLILQQKYIFCATNLFARKVNCPLQGIAGGTFLYITFFEV